MPKKIFKSKLNLAISNSVILYLLPGGKEKMKVKVDWEKIMVVDEHVDEGAYAERQKLHSITRLYLDKEEKHCLYVLEAWGEHF